MKLRALSALAAAAALGVAEASQAAASASPIEKVLELLANQVKKVTDEGNQAKRLYEEASKWCVERSEELKFEIKTGSANAADLKATIEQEVALAAALSTNVDKLSSAIATHEANLKEATAVQEKEMSDFAATEKELMEAIDTVSRAITILERELRKGKASMLQLKGASDLVSAISMMVEASSMSLADAQQLTSLIQNTENSEDSDSELDASAPQAAAYQSQSGGIINTLKDLRDKAEVQLDDARKKAQQSRHNFQLLKGSLENQLRLANKELNEAKQGIAKSSEKRSKAEGDYSATTNELQADEVALEQLRQDCLTKAQDFEAESKSREEELKALGTAEKAIKEATGGAAQSTYGLEQLSFVQVSARAHLVSEAASMQVVHLLRKLAREAKSVAMMQLASSVSTALDGESSDPFAKVKGMIKNMLEKLENEAGADASQKAYCDKEMGEATTKQEDKKQKEAKLSTQIEQMSARSAQLKDEVAALQKGLAALATSQAEMDKLRQQEKVLFEQSKKDLELGLEGVKKALKALRDFYGNSDAAAGGAGSGIIGLLEVVESDFSKGLTECVAAEDKAVINYVQTSKQNEVEKAAKNQDVAYKTKEATELDKAAADALADRTVVSKELDAIEEYLAKLNEQCVGKAEPYEEKVARRSAEINGLKQALEILSADAASLLQRSTVRRTLRGVRPHA